MISSDTIDPYISRRVQSSAPLPKQIGGEVVRLRHIDRIRAIAILCMVQVHTAAIIALAGISIDHPLAFVSAAIGGMAAPLFVTISGWAMYTSAKRRSESENNDFSSWMRWVLPRFTILVLCQLFVNSALLLERGGRFEWMTPGVLTLLALATLLGPALIFLKKGQRVLLLLLLIISPLIIGDLSGLGFSWVERVSSQGFEQWIARLLLNGTYPALPWLAFIVLGTLIEDYREDASTKKIVKFGLMLIGMSMVFSFYNDIPWALTKGDAVLTFFPANSPFIFTSVIFVIILFKLLQGDEMSGGEPLGGARLSWLEPAGRLSLTIYVIHFVVLGIIAFEMQNQPRSGVYLTFLFTIVHTSIWIPLAILHEKYISEISFEGLLRKFN
jgi:surface polysaccharide O-acyltransferase-like enzyme